jgi:HK97 family phage major capsid protein
MGELLKQLMEKRYRQTEELRSFYADAEKRAENGEWAGEDRSEFERRNETIAKLDADIKTIKDHADAETHLDGLRSAHERALPAAGAGPDEITDPNVLEARKVAEFFMGKGGRSLDVSFKDLRVERDGNRNVVHDIERRTGLLEGAGATGGFTFASSFRALLYQHLIFNSAIRQTRATVLVTDSGESMLLPKTTSHPAKGTIVAEGAAINENDPAFGQGTLSAYKYANLVQVSTELETDTAVDLLGYLAKAMGTALGNGSGTDYVTGSGTSKPQGVLVGAGTIAQILGGTPAASGATFSELTQVFDNIIPPYQINAEWLIGQSALQKIRALVNSQGTPIYLESLSGSQPATLFGKPVIVDPNMPAVAIGGTSIAFGDFSPYFIRDVAGVRFERSVDYAFNADLNTYRAILRTDGRLLDLTGAIAVYKGGTA